MTRKSQENVSYIETNTFLYRLDDHMKVIPVPMDNLHESLVSIMHQRWGYQTQTEVALISSVFLGVATPSIFNVHPLCFETMVFNREGESVWTARYRTMDECVDGHHAILKLIEQLGEAAWSSDPDQSSLFSLASNDKDS